MNSDEIIFQRGLPENYRSEAALLYDAAFGEKFSAAIKSEKQRIAFLEDSIIPEYSITAIHNDKLVGVAGFSIPEGSFTGGFFKGNEAYKELISRLGFLKGTWAALVLSLYERKPVPGELLMDGIAVNDNYRGKGIGSGLLNEITRYAQENKYGQVRLDVIDTNTRAKKLYERKGFKAVETVKFPYLKWLLGFSSSTTMTLNIKQTVTVKEA